ncbi:MAG: conjugal transfer protein TraB, partial [Promethearchaeota archaeon]
KPKESKKGEWRTVWDKNKWNLVSYLPEDIFEENYFHHVRTRSMNLLKDDNIKTHEFTSTLMDGIDFRETIRNWAYKKKIYVKEKRTIRGEVDSVVIIFNRDEITSETEEKFPHQQMWYAEHLKESDLAFYSTFPGIDLVGPGISRIELGGVVSFFPPRNIPDIWNDKFFKNYPMGKKKADKLLLAALLFAQKPFITYVAKNKPDAIFYSMAARLRVKIIYLPLDRFNPVSLRALRNLHVLAGKKIRSYAHKYIHKRRY